MALGADINDFSRRLLEKERQRKLTGQTPLQGSQLRDMTEGYYGAAAKDNSDRYFRGLALEQSAEKIQADKDAADAAAKGQTLGTLGNVATTGLGLKYLYGAKDTVVNPSLTFAPTAGGAGVSSTPASFTPSSYASLNTTAAPSLASEATAGLGTSTAAPSYASTMTGTSEFAIPAGEYGFATTGTEAAIGTGTAAPSTGSVAIGGAAEAGAGVEAAGGMLGTAASFAAPAAAGYAAPKLLDSIHKDSTENLGHNLSFGLARSEKDATVLGSTATGAAAGAAIGSVVPVVGTAIGGVIGGAVGFLSSVFDF